MLRVLILLFMVSTCLLHGQDKLYFLNGESRLGKVLEIGLEEVVYLKGQDTLRVPRFNLMFIEYEKGRTEVLNRPVWDQEYLPSSSAIQTPNKNTIIENHPNQVYLNTLSLINCDISIYYEYLLKSRPIGLGCFGSYNFNTYAGFANSFIAVLSNGKKLYDVGVFLTAYAKQRGDHQLFYGLTIKYTEFNYSAAILDTIYQGTTPSVLVNYVDAKGQQISPLFHAGVHSNINEMLFIKTSFSLGFFHLSELYSQQFSYATSSPGTEPIETSFLIKAGIGLSIGFRF